jgi:hypothetical protein
MRLTKNSGYKKEERLPIALEATVFASLPDKKQSQKL